jgi:sugar lactone lactonase YvrE
MHLRSSFALLVAAVTLAACSSSDSPVAAGGGGSTTPPWTTGQAAEAVLGATAVGSIGSNAVTQSTFKGPWGLAVTNTGTLYVHDNSAYRVLRFDNANTKANGANADGVLGQSTFTASTWNGGLAGSTAVTNGFVDGLGIAVDATGTFYLSDAGNTRVMRWNAAAGKANGANADGVLGQPDLVTNGFNTTASKFFAVAGVATDAAGRVWVADGSNNRVLRFDNAAALANGAAASGVLGQADFVTGTSGTTATKMKNPTSVTVDASGNLYVGERGNSRVLIFLNAATKANGTAADKVLGQPDFVSGTNNGVTGTQANIYLPYALTTDLKGNLYVADGGFNRVLVFYAAASKANGANADVVLGKASFTDVSTTAASASNVGQPYGIAVQSSTGKLWVTDYSNLRVLRFQAAAALQ